jgi:DNA-binding transcriptional ArsR family regulator
LPLAKGRGKRAVAIRDRRTTADGVPVGRGALDIRLYLYKQHVILFFMHAFDVLGDPVRRRILELLARGELAAGEISAIVEREFGISQPAVSQHLRVLRDSGFATVRPAGARRLYAVDPTPLREVAEWVDRYRRYWNESFDSLDAHLAEMQRKPAGVARADRTKHRRSSK